MSNGSDNFSNNIDLLMAHLRLTQSELAEKVDFPRTTVNKWFISNAIPNEDNLRTLCFRINALLISSCPDADRAKKIDTKLLLGNSYEFASAINMPWYKVSSVINKARIPVKNLVFEPNDKELLTIVGFYTIFYPSVAYEGAFFAAALKIQIDPGDEFFYFSQFNERSTDFDNNNKTKWELPRLYHSGSVGRYGSGNTSNAMLIGDLVGERGEDAESFVQFTTFKVPRESRPNKLLGRVLALNFNKESPSYGHVLSTPAVAVAIHDVPLDRSVKELTPEKAYFDIHEMKRQYADVVNALEQSPVPWCYQCVVLDRGR